MPETNAQRCPFTHSYQQHCAALFLVCVFTWMGVYHFLFWGGFLLCAFLGLGSNGSYSCSGIFTTAFLGFSSFAPSSVEPFPPQRTYTGNVTGDKRAEYVHIFTYGVYSFARGSFLALLMCLYYLHPLDPTNSPPSII